MKLLYHISGLIETLTESVQSMKQQLPVSTLLLLLLITDAVQDESTRDADVSSHAEASATSTISESGKS